MGPWITSAGTHRSTVLQDGTEVFFKIKKNTTFRKLIDAYCKRQGASEDHIAFLYDGSRLRPEQTPEQVCHSHTA